MDETRVGGTEGGTAMGGDGDSSASDQGSLAGPLTGWQLLQWAAAGALHLSNVPPRLVIASGAVLLLRHRLSASAVMLVLGLAVFMIGLGRFKPAVPLPVRRPFNLGTTASANPAKCPFLGRGRALVKFA